MLLVSGESLFELDREVEASACVMGEEEDLIVEDVVVVESEEEVECCAGKVTVERSLPQ